MHAVAIDGSKIEHEFDRVHAALKAFVDRMERRIRPVDRVHALGSDNDGRWADIRSLVKRVGKDRAV